MLILLIVYIFMANMVFGVGGAVMAFLEDEDKDVVCAKALIGGLFGFIMFFYFAIKGIRKILKGKDNAKNKGIK